MMTKELANSLSDLGFKVDSISESNENFDGEITFLNSKVTIQVYGKATVWKQQENGSFLMGKERNSLSKLVSDLIEFGLKN